MPYEDEELAYFEPDRELDALASSSTSTSLF